MKHQPFKLSSGLLLVIISLFLVGTARANADLEIYAKTTPTYIWFEGEQINFVDSAGNELLPLTYNESIYIPIMSAGELLGKNVIYNLQSKTVEFSINSERVIHNIAEYEPQQNGDAGVTMARNSAVEIELCPDYNVSFDGQPWKLQNALGEILTPLKCENTLYIPIRDVIGKCGMEIVWVGVDNRQSLYIRTKLEYNEIVTVTNYISTGSNLCEELDEKLNLLWAQRESENADFNSAFSDIKDCLNSIDKIANPNVKIADYVYLKITELTSEMMNSINLGINDYHSGGRTVYTPDYYFLLQRQYAMISGEFSSLKIILEQNQ